MERWRAPRNAPLFRLVDLVEILEFIIGVGNDGVGAGFPSGRTDFAVLIRVLECLDQAERLVHGSTHREIIHRDLPQGSLAVDDEEASEGVAGIFEEDAVIPGDLVRQIGEERDVERAEAAVLSRRLDPGQVRELGIDGHAHHFRVDGAEFVGPVTEGDNFRGADEGKIEGVEEEDEIFALVHVEIEILELSVDDGRAFPVRRRLGDERFADGKRVRAFGRLARVNEALAERMTSFLFPTRRQTQTRQQQ